MRLHLIRHPAPRVEEGVCYGRTDLGLRFPVEEAAAVLRPWLQQLPANVPVFSSPLRRCIELATALHPTPRIDDRLQELHFGQWEMKTWETIGQEALNVWAADPLGFAPPGGESVTELKHRVTGFLDQYRNEYDEAVLVTHAGVIKTLVGHAQNLPTGEWLMLEIAYGSLTTITLSGTSAD